jgi:lipoprotein-anchoring transpeptidase ErfK/SrfK
MQRSPRVLRASALATALAGLLALATPLTNGLAAVDPARDAAFPEITDSRLRERATVRPAQAVVPTDPAPATDRDATARSRVSILVRVPAGGAVARKAPRASAPAIGRVVDRSRYYGVRTVAWVEEVSANGRWGRVELPYVWPRRDGWVRIAGLRTDATGIRVEVDLSAHRLTVRKRGAMLFGAPVATGRSSSPTPPGEYFVTDRVSFPSGSAYGSFAFGISGIQPRLPAGWGGGDQLAIHGTNAPSTIGTSASAGCLRASEATLARLKPLLRLGTPVVIAP